MSAQPRKSWGDPLPEEVELPPILGPCWSLLYIMLLPLLLMMGLPTATAPESPIVGTGMKLESVTRLDDGLAITTTGARVDVHGQRLLLHSRIDAQKGQFVAPRLAARLEFDRPVGPWEVQHQDPTRVVLNGAGVLLEIHADSLCLLTASAPLSYEWSVPTPAEWAKGSGANRHLAWPTGGALHLAGRGQSATDSGAQTIATVLPAGQTAGLAVLPPRLPLPRQPHPVFLFSSTPLREFPRQIPAYGARGFGTVVLFHGLFRGGKSKPLESNGQEYYAWEHPLAVRACINACHAAGIKVLGYINCPQWSRTSDADLLNWMEAFAKEWNLDGWYGDNFDRGDWLRTYYFVRNLRQQVGPDGILFHHDSVDVWGSWSGCTFHTINSHCNYTFKGETGVLARIDRVDSPYLEYVTHGRWSGATHTHKLTTDSTLPQESLTQWLARTGGVYRIGVGGRALADWEQNYAAYLPPGDAR